MDTMAAARGRWRQILLALGIPDRLLNGKPQPCPFCGGTDRFVFDDKHKDGDFFCRQCGAGKGMAFLMRTHSWTFKEAANEVDKIIGNLPPIRTSTPKVRRLADPKEIERLWASGLALTKDDPVEWYLFERDLPPLEYRRHVPGYGSEPPDHGDIPREAWDEIRHSEFQYGWADNAPTEPMPLQDVLRYVPELWNYKDNKSYPGMIALFSNADGKPATIHRTYLTPRAKFDVTPVRMFMPGMVPKGGAIRLFEAAEIMGVAEGIETALSAAQIFGLPVWAVTSAVMLRHWQPPPEARLIWIYADHDKNFVGQRAAYDLASRLKTERPDRVVDVNLPEFLGTDFNDKGDFFPAYTEEEKTKYEERNKRYAERRVRFGQLAVEPLRHTDIQA